MIEKDEYLSMEGEALPYTTKWGFTLTNVDVTCPDCGKQTTNQKFRFNEFQTSLDIVGVGMCTRCKLIVTGKSLRIYQDGRMSWQGESGEWITQKMHTDGWFNRLKNWVTRR